MPTGLHNYKIKHNNWTYVEKYRAIAVSFLTECLKYPKEWSLRNLLCTTCFPHGLTLFKYTRPYMHRLHIIKFHYLKIRIFCGEYLISHPWAQQLSHKQHDTEILLPLGICRVRFSPAAELTARHVTFHTCRLAHSKQASHLLKYLSIQDKALAFQFCRKILLSCVFYSAVNCLNYEYILSELASTNNINPTILRALMAYQAHTLSSNKILWTPQEYSKH
jgi:hypothetical protein